MSTVVGNVRSLLEMIRFSHTLFALPFALLSAAMAWKANASQQPPIGFRPAELVGIVLCMVFGRSAAMAFNRLVDRRIDAENPRTAGRHLPSGRLSVAAVTVFTAVCSIGFVGATLLFWPNWLPLAGSVPVLAYLFGYSYAKRFTSLAHFWLGGALMLAPVAAWVALRASMAAPPLLLGLAVLFWVAGFDVLYACQDFEFDRHQGLHSIPARLGVGQSLRLAAACHLVMLVCLALLPVYYPWFGLIYWANFVVIALLLAYEHWLVGPNDLTRVNQAFFHVNAVISLGLLATGIADLVW